MLYAVFFFFSDASVLRTTVAWEREYRFDNENVTRGTKR
jgi:hypothetical protein